MQSLIVIAEKNQGLAYIAQESVLFPQTHSLDQLVIEPEPSIGIDAIRAAQSFLISPPLKSTSKRIIVIDAHAMTVEAQNSMLKILEEPQPYVQIILLTASVDLLLPTVQSRCQIIQLQIQPEEISAEAVNLAAKLEFASISEKIALAQPFAKSKQEAIEIIKQLLHTQQAQLSSKGSLKHVNRIEALFDALTKLQANSNTRLVLEQRFFSW